MILIDTDVLIDIWRQVPAAVGWLQSNNKLALALPGLVVLEIVQGCKNLQDQRQVVRMVKQYDWYWPSSDDGNRAFVDFTRLHLSHGIGMLDCLIAHTAIGLNADLATFNLKHYKQITDLHTIQPYLR